jgi:predicted aspartyl protease
MSEPPNPEIVAAIERARKIVGDFERLAATAAPHIEQSAHLLDELTAINQGALGGALQRLTDAVRFADATLKTWHGAMPSNWVGVEDVIAIVDRVRDTGFALTWVPRAAIVLEIVGADSEETAAILLTHRDEVLDDIEECLAQVDDPDVELTRTAIEQAVAALRDGHVWAAQALATSAFTSELHSYTEQPRLNAIRVFFERDDIEEAPILEVRFRTVFVAAAHALSEFDALTCLPVRPRFNRHNTAHRITPEQWNVRNALSAILLATAFLREMTTDNEPRAPRPQ